jgi:inorganic pyrophosphatase
MTRVLAVLLLALYQTSAPLTTLPAFAVTSLRASVEAAGEHTKHLWRDTPPRNTDGSVNGYIEIPRGERRKFEFNIGTQERVVDRIMSAAVGGYPCNYGFVPQTISYDGDPFDVLILGPALRGGVIVRGVIVGLMRMEDEKGLDSKVVLSPVDDFGRAIQPLRMADQRRIAQFFNRYKQGERDKFSRVLGWGSIGEGRAFVEQTHAFFEHCASQREGDCTVK